MAQTYRRQQRQKWNRGHRTSSFLRNKANQLARGREIRNARHHHQGMAVLKARLGDPRPDGLTLSLINPTSPSCYYGVHPSRKTPYLLSTDPNDYTWESLEDNLARRDI